MGAPSRRGVVGIAILVAQATTFGCGRESPPAEEDGGSNVDAGQPEDAARQVTADSGIGTADSGVDAGAAVDAATGLDGGSDGGSGRQAVAIVQTCHPAAGFETINQPTPADFANSGVTYEHVQYQAFSDQPDAGFVDIAYGVKGSTDEPLIVLIHGGAWEVGDSTLIAGDQLYWSKQGYVVASLNYHLLLRSCQVQNHPTYLSDGGVIGVDGTQCPIAPQPISDVRCAVRFLLNHAATYHIDTTKLFVGGGSAGAHLAGLLALSSETSDFDVPAGQPGACSDLNTAIPQFQGANLFYPPTNLAAVNDWDATLPDGGNFNGGKDAVESLIGSAAIGGGINASNYAWFSPLDHVGAPHAPPFFITNGSADVDVPPAQSRELYDQLQAAGVPSTYFEVAGGGHAFSRYGYCPAGGCGGTANYVPAECTAIAFILQQVPLN
jgi:acetyl esterase/lipase